MKALCLICVDNLNNWIIRVDCFYSGKEDVKFVEEEYKFDPFDNKNIFKMPALFIKLLNERPKKKDDQGENE